MFIILIGLSYGVNISGCQENVFVGSNISICSNFLTFPTTYHCGNMFQYDLDPNIDWVTEFSFSFDINGSPDTYIAQSEWSAAPNLTSFNFKYIEVYPDSPPNLFGFPIAFEISAKINDVWSVIITETEFNLTVQQCRESGDWLRDNQPYCARYEVNVIGATELQINVTDVVSRRPDPSNLFINEIMGCGEASSSSPCEFPSLFCDNFNYNISMNTRDWIVYGIGDSVNNSFTPINNELQLKNEQYISPFHETDVFETTYRPDPSGSFTKHFLAPVFSSEFTLNFVNQSDNRFRYTAAEKQFRPAWSIKAELNSPYSGNNSGDMTWSYQSAQQPSTEWTVICANCSQSEIPIYVKINTFFQQREIFPFNSSIENDTVILYLNNVKAGEFNGFLSSVDSVKQYEITKLDNGNFTLDNYLVMVGTDPNTYTGEQYYDDLFINETEEVIIIGSGTGDLATAVGTIWDDFGLRSQASRIMTGVFLMFLLSLILFGITAANGNAISPITLLIVEFFFMILLTYIRLLPLWIPFVIVLMVAGIGAIVFKMSSG